MQEEEITSKVPPTKIWSWMKKEPSFKKKNLFFA